MGQIKICVGIPTYMRPICLKNLLISIKNIEIPSEHEVIIVIADNEVCDSEVLNVVSQAGIQQNYKVDVIKVHERGISSVRNALIKRAFSHHHCEMLAMVDDDVTVTAHWLIRMTDLMYKGNYDIVAGAVYPDFEIEPPEWVKHLNVYYREIPAQENIPVVNGTTSVLIHKRVIEITSESFDVNFGLSGGGDKEFFVRIKKKGFNFGFARDSHAYEFFPKARITENWAVNRYKRIGEGDARVEILHSTYRERVFSFLKSLAAVPFFFFLSLIKIDDKKVLHKAKLARHLGKFSGYFGRVSIYY